MADTLKTYDEALASAYVAKTGKTKAEILKMMNEETWLTAEKAVELGFIDEIAENTPQMTNAEGMMAVTPEMKKEYEAAMQKKKDDAKIKDDLLKDLDLFGV